MGSWREVIPDEDQQVYQEAGFCQRQGLGNRPAVLVVDVTYDFVGERPEPIHESLKKFRLSCGPRGWEAIGQIRVLIDAAREARVPLIYTYVERRPDGSDVGMIGTKNRRAHEGSSMAGSIGPRIVAEIGPRDNDLLISKKFPSAFFGTPLLSHLIELGVDTLLVSGCTTSGCVRSTVVDAFSYNFRVSVVEECTFDRGELNHEVSLFDMNAKYADVITIDEATAHLRSIQRTKASSGATGRVSP